jgi:DNA-binding LacI/PurR family transcriptional regulator
MSKPKVVVIGAGAKQRSMIAVDLDDTKEAFALAKRLAEQTGRTITVRDADGQILDTFPAVTRN